MKCTTYNKHQVRTDVRAYGMLRGLLYGQPNRRLAAAGAFLGQLVDAQGYSRSDIAAVVAAGQLPSQRIVENMMRGVLDVDGPQAWPLSWAALPMLDSLTALRSNALPFLVFGTAGAPYRPQWGDLVELGAQPMLYVGGEDPRLIGFRFAPSDERAYRVEDVMLLARENDCLVGEGDLVLEKVSTCDRLYRIVRGLHRSRSCDHYVKVCTSL